LTAFLIGLALSARAQTPSDADAASSGIAGNPGAASIVAGTGELGRLLSLDPETGLRLGGVLVSNGNYLAMGGNTPGTTNFNNLLVSDLDTDFDKFAHISGASLGAAVLRFDRRPTNQQARVVSWGEGIRRSRESLPSWFHRVGRTRFAHRTMGRPVEEARMRQPDYLARRVERLGEMGDEGRARRNSVSRAVRDSG
jgi:hypothetical protein